MTDGTHLVAYSREELHAFAEKIGLKREWFQDKGGKHIPHYDLFGRMCGMAEACGAAKVDTRTLIIMWREIGEWEPPSWKEPDSCTR